MKVSFIATVFNEEGTINNFLKSIVLQSRLPDEIIIVDGGSSDRTVASIKYYVLSMGKNFRNTRFKVLIKKGNRAVGRNEAIKNSSNEIIICSDAGCVLDENWVKNIIKPFENTKVGVVAGYYKGDSKNIFQKSLIPYVLVMPDKISDNFLPATRSMAFRKSIWKKAGEFPEEFSNNEDYVFAKKLKKIKAIIVFEKKAIVYWKPSNNIRDAFVMFYRFAKGDSESRILRPKVILIFVRYFVCLILLSLFFFLRSYGILNALYIMLFLYALWSIFKNYKYVKDIGAIFYLPLLQFISDIAVIYGTIAGLFSKYNKI